VLDALFGLVDVGGDAHRRGEHEGPLTTVRVVHRGADRRIDGHGLAQSRVLMGRTSTPPKGAGTALAMARASSSRPLR